MTTFLRFDGHLAEDMTFTRRMGWETGNIAHRPHDGDGSYTRERREENFPPLVAVSPPVVFDGCDTGAEGRLTRVIAYLPLRPEGRELVFRGGDIEIHREPVAAAPPRVRITRLAPRAAGTVGLSWEGSAPGPTPRVAYLAGG